MSIHKATRKHHQKFAEKAMKRSGHKAGGKVSKETKTAVHKHEEHDHPGKPLTRLKRGGMAPGKEPMKRLDKRARHAGGGEVFSNGPRIEERKLPQPKINVDSMKSERPMRAMGGRTSAKHGKTNIIIHAGGGEQQNPAALQAAQKQGMQKGMQMGAIMGAKAAASKMGGGAGGPPMGGAPGGMPPGGPPMGGAPPGAGAMPPPMHAKGGKVNHRPDDVIKVREHSRRKRGGAC